MGEFISAHNLFFNNRQHPGYWATANGRKGSAWNDANGSDPAWMPADFAPAQAIVKKFEGGYSDDKRDPGNYTGGKIGVGTLIGTNHGISAPVLVAELKRLGGAPPTASTMKNLQYNSAVAIYKRNYWAPIKGDEIKDQQLATILYDTAVNQGPGKAQGYVKDTLGISSYDVAKINAANPASLSNSIIAKRKATYEQIGGYALKSWLGRLDDLKDGIKQNKGKTVLVVLGLSALIGGIYIYNKNN